MRNGKVESKKRLERSVIYIALIILAFILAATLWFLTGVALPEIKAQAPVDQVVERSSPEIERTIDPSGDCASVTSPITHRFSRDMASLVEWLRESNGSIPGQGSSFSHQPVKVGADSLKSSMVSPDAGLRVNVNAFIDVKGGVLSVLPYFSELLWNPSGQSADTQHVGFGFPLLIVTDATGSGAGWHLNVRTAKDIAQFGFLHCVEFALSNEGIGLIFGNQKPISLLVQSTRLNNLDQILVFASPGQGMGTYAIAPVFTSAPSGREVWNVDSHLIVVSLIASP